MRSALLRNASANASANREWRDGVRSVFREFKRGNPNASVIGYSQAGSAVGEYRVGLTDVEQIVADGFIDAWIDQSWAGAFQDVPSRNMAGLGWTAQLETYFHDVSGTAEIVDDCHVVISDFVYDGQGIDVRIYGARGGNFDSGFAMTEDLLDSKGYNGVTLTAKLPSGQSMETLDGISVWCVDVGVDFGSGQFQP